MNWLQDAGHLFRLAAVFAIGLVWFFVARGFMVPHSFGEYGHYRGDARNCRPTGPPLPATRFHGPYQALLLAHRGPDCLGNAHSTALLAVTQVVRLSEGAGTLLYALAGSLTLIGIFAMRWNVVIGGQLFSKSFSGTQHTKWV